jgi:hypothetical protein
VNARGTALLLALLTIGLTLAQDIAPARDWYHSWQYATILALAILVMIGYAWGARAGSDGPGGKQLALAMVGAVAVGIAGLLSGLIGPDTLTVIGTPGTVTPLPDLGVAAFFAPAGPESLLRGDATVTLRRRGDEPLDVGTRPLPLGMSVLFTSLRPAAFVVARDANGNRLTVTQPNNASFLSPVVLFRASQPIRDKTFPMDTVAVPAAHRIIRVLFFGADDLAAFRHGLPGPGGDGAVLSVADDAGNERGLTIAASGRETTVGGMRLTVTLGRYPVLVVASAPQPAVTIAGCVLFVIAAAWGLIVGGTRKPEAIELHGRNDHGVGVAARADLLAPERAGAERAD